jgi:hypothetical protein
MELREIFCHESNRIFSNWGQVTSSYRKLWRSFGAFAQALKRPSERAGVDIFEWVEQGENAFRIEACGVQLTFCFDMVDGGSHPGRVNCTSRPGHKQFEADQVGSFLFNEDGLMQYDFDHKGPLNICDRDAATAILVEFMVAALKTPRALPDWQSSGKLPPPKRQN